MAAAHPRFLTPLQWGFVALMAGLTVLFVWLGLWQVERLAEKEALIATVEERAGLPPAPLPPLDQWAAIDPESYDYRPVTATGRLDHTRTIRVFTSLSSARGQYGSAGYWIMVPMMLEEGGTLWVNRGFVPQDLSAGFADGGDDAPEGIVTVAGLARQPEPANPFTPAPEGAERIDWVRDPARLSARDPGADAHIAPFTVDAPAGAPGALPQGGETVMTFSNRHLEYAGTWFIFALITPVMLGFWLWRQRRG